MENSILEALAEYDKQFESIDTALEVYSRRELLDMWLKYEGITGYTWQILSIMHTLGYDVEVEDV